MADNHPDFERHMTEREQRITAAREEPVQIASGSSVPGHWNAGFNPILRSSALTPVERPYEARFTRTTVLSIISAVIQDDDLAPYRALEQLEECKDACGELGVPFSELLGENMEPSGIPPLLYEIVQFTDPTVLEFLLEHAPRRGMEAIIRRGCMIRADSEVFQGLRARLSSEGDAELLPCDLTVTEIFSGFHVNLIIPNLPAVQELLQRDPQLRKRPPPRPIEWMAEGRIWSLEITPDGQLTFRLLEGSSADMTVKLILFRRPVEDEEDKHDPAIPPKVLEDGRITTTAASVKAFLVPLEQAGQHSITLTPQLPPLGRPLSLQECCNARGALAMRMDVLFDEEMVSRDLSSREECIVDGDEWEAVEGAKNEWVLASWSGRDTDADE